MLIDREAANEEERRARVEQLVEEYRVRTENTLTIAEEFTREAAATCAQARRVRAQSQQLRTRTAR